MTGRRRDVLHVIGGYYPDQVGGTQRQLEDLARAQQRSGRRVAVVTTAPDGRARPERSVRGIPVLTLAESGPSTPGPLAAFHRPGFEAPFREVLRSRPSAIVHFHHLGGLGLSLVDVAARLGFPTVLLVSDFWLHCLRGQRWHPGDMAPCPTSDAPCLGCLESLWPGLQASVLDRWRLHRDRALACVDALVAPSRAHADELAALGVPTEKLFTVPHGLDAGPPPPRERDDRARVVGYIGLVAPSKGVHVLVQAFNLLDRADLRLEIHGPEPPFHEVFSYPDLLRSLVAPGLDVRFRGPYRPTDLAEILERIDLLVVPALWKESYCFTAREGARAGLPVVVARIGALAELADRGAAAGFTPGRADELASVLERLLGDRHARRRLVAAARREVAEPVCDGQIDAIYDRLTAAERTRRGSLALR